jgi:hypothetical protein
VRGSAGPADRVAERVQAVADQPVDMLHARCDKDVEQVIGYLPQGSFSTSSCDFAPRDLATPLTALLANGIPDTPVLLGL